jgi:uncharacterized cupin superfamily protein
LAAADNAIN